MGCIQEDKDRNHALGRRRPFAARADGLHPGEQGRSHFFILRFIPSPLLLTPLIAVALCMGSSPSW
jgi:hypothetical protein